MDAAGANRAAGVSAVTHLSESQAETNRQIGRFIRRNRRSRNMTQTELAHRAGLDHYQIISKYETGVLTIPAAKLLDIATALGMGVQWLYPVSGPSADPVKYGEIRA